MPIPTYAGLEEFKQWLESDPGDPQNHLDNQLLTWCLEAATQDFEIATGRTFYAVETARYYGSRGGTDLVTHDLTEIEEIATDTAADGLYSDVWDESDYVLDPPNAIADGLAYTRVRAIGDRRFPETIAGTRVTGTFGLTVEGEPPALVKLAVLVGANRWLHRRATPLGTETTPDAQGMSTTRQIKADYDYDRAVKRYARTDQILTVIPVIVPERPSIFRLAHGYRGR